MEGGAGGEMKALKTDWWKDEVALSSGSLVSRRSEETEALAAERRAISRLRGGAR
jgi:hypothetical protein